MPVPAPSADRIHLSFCDGMGAAAYDIVLPCINADITRSIGVEIDPTKRVVCNNLNPPELSPFGGIDHSWKSDVFDIARADIAKLGLGSIVRLDIAGPCKEFSLLALRPSKT